MFWISKRILNGFFFWSGLFLRTVTRVKVMVHLKETLKILILMRKSESIVQPPHLQYQNSYNSFLQ